LPPGVSFQWDDDTVYFAETILAQLQSNGTGFGTFGMDSSMVATPNVKLGGSGSGNAPNGRNLSQALEPGAILRFVQMSVVVLSIS
jgi:hypothetical protein